MQTHVPGRWIPVVVLFLVVPAVVRGISTVPTSLGSKPRAAKKPSFAPKVCPIATACHDIALKSSVQRVDGKMVWRGAGAKRA
jgi:hypothetical protein